METLKKCKINNDNLIMINKQKEIEMIKLKQLKNESDILRLKLKLKM